MILLTNLHGQHSGNNDANRQILFYLISTYCIITQISTYS
jgi:hypothetical protein